VNGGATCWTLFLFWRILDVVRSSQIVCVLHVQLLPQQLLFHIQVLTNVLILSHLKFEGLSFVAAPASIKRVVHLILVQHGIHMIRRRWASVIRRRSHSARHGTNEGACLVGLGVNLCLLVFHQSQWIYLFNLSEHVALH